MRYPEAVIILAFSLFVRSDPAFPAVADSGRAVVSPPNSTPITGSTGKAARPSSQGSQRKPNGRAPAPPRRPPPAPTASFSGVGAMRGISNPSRVAWRNKHHRHHRTVFIFYDPFWPFFAYSSFFNYCAAPIAYGPPGVGYACEPVYGATPSYSEVASSYPPPILPGERAEPDKLAAETGGESSPFALQAEKAFQSRDFKGAVRAWRHAIVDDPNNGALLLRLGQALFAAGLYDEAAGATQQALTLLPEENWQPEAGKVAKLYADPQDYNDQLRALEKAVRENLDDPALSFELGFQYGLSDRRPEAQRELDRLLKIAPEDQLGRRLRDLMAAKTAGETSAESKK
jgi:cytochrome c-type biogenesis protein CcmH/NrfG